MTIRAFSAVRTAARPSHERAGSFARREATVLPFPAGRVVRGSDGAGGRDRAGGDGRCDASDGTGLRSAATAPLRAARALWRAVIARCRQAVEARSLAALDARTLRDLGLEPDHPARGAGRADRWR
jgi:uncharacterized protein YjiS (DUF1127 family)